MIRFAWTQSRTQALAAAALLAVLAIALGVTGPHLAHLYDTTVASCGSAGDCQTATSVFLQEDHLLRLILEIIVVVAPALTGLFWGAPLIARELEEGTFRLAWTQSVTRTRWLAVHLAVGGLTCMAAAGLLSLMVTWWFAPVGRAAGTPFTFFDYNDVVPVGYAAFAFALGVTAGVLIRRTVPAMAIALAAFAAVRVSLTTWVRPGLIPADHQTLPLNVAGYGSEGNILFGLPASGLEPASPDIPGAWINSVQIVSKSSGKPLTASYLNSTCPGIGGGGGAHGPLNPLSGGSSHTQAPAGRAQLLQDCVARVSGTYHELVTYQPASHYWPLQWYELGIYLAGAIALAAFCLWRIRRTSG
jgi:hypothetical protein